MLPGVFLRLYFLTHQPPLRLAGGDEPSFVSTDVPLLCSPLAAPTRVQGREEKFLCCHGNPQSPAIEPKDREHDSRQVQTSNASKRCQRKPQNPPCTRQLLQTYRRPADAALPCVHGYVKHYGWDIPSSLFGVMSVSYASVLVKFLPNERFDSLADRNCLEWPRKTALCTLPPLLTGAKRTNSSNSYDQVLHIAETLGPRIEQREIFNICMHGKQNPHRRVSRGRPDFVKRAAWKTMREKVGRLCRSLALKRRSAL